MAHNISSSTENNCTYTYTLFVSMFGTDAIAWPMPLRWKRFYYFRAGNELVNPFDQGWKTNAREFFAQRLSPWPPKARAGGGRMAMHAVPFPPAPRSRQLTAQPPHLAERPAERGFRGVVS